MKKVLMLVILILSLSGVAYGASYSNDLNANDWLYMLNNGDINVLTNIAINEDMYQKWYNFTYGMSDQDIATTLNISLQKAQDMNANFSIFHEIYQCLTNQTCIQKDRKTIMLKFR